MFMIDNYQLVRMKVLKFTNQISDMILPTNTGPVWFQYVWVKKVATTTGIKKFNHEPKLIGSVLLKFS